MLRKTLLATLCASTLLAVSAPVLAATTQDMQSEQGTLEVTPIATGLAHPWALAFLPDRQGMLVTERAGQPACGNGRGQIVGAAQRRAQGLGQGAGRLAGCGAVP